MDHMAYSESRKNTVLQKYHTKLLHTLSDCIEDVLPDLESAGAISGEQRDKVREYVHGKMPANAVDYLLNDHIKRPLSVELSNNFMKLLEVMKKIPRCLPQCKALAMAVEEDLKNDEMSSEMDEITTLMQGMGNKSRQKITEGCVGKDRQTSTAGSGLIPTGYMLYEIHKYGPTLWRYQLKEPLFLAKGPSGEVIVCDHGYHRLVVYSSAGNKLEYSRYMCGEGNGYGKFKYITGIAASKDYLYVADAQLDCIQKLRLHDGVWVKTIGSSDSEDGKFNPFGLVLDEAKSRLYVCDCDNHRIQIINCEDNCDKLFVKSFGGKGTSEGNFNHPKDIALYLGAPGYDTLYITDFDNGRVQMFKTNGLLIRVFKYISNPFGIFYANYYNTLLISSVDTGDNCVYMYKSGGVDRVVTPTGFECPCGVIMMDNEQIVVANYRGNKLTVV